MAKAPTLLAANVIADARLRVSARF